jgi:hypothetical protein
MVDPTYNGPQVLFSFAWGMNRSDTGATAAGQLAIRPD